MAILLPSPRTAADSIPAALTEAVMAERSTSRAAGPIEIGAPIEATSGYVQSLDAQERPERWAIDLNS